MCADAVHREEQRDVVIVGAGVAGVSCALECFDIQLDTDPIEMTNAHAPTRTVNSKHSHRRRRPRSPAATARAGVPAPAPAVS